MEEERTYNKIQVVDENDNPLGAMSYHEAIDKGCIRRASRVYVFNQSGKILIQRRSKHISKPMLFDGSAAGHVDEGETYAEAAARELKEELGISGYELTLIEHARRTTHFFSDTYKVVVPDNVVVDIDSHEVHDFLWMSVTEIDSLVIERKDECHVPFVEVWSNLKDKLIQ